MWILRWITRNMKKNGIWNEKICFKIEEILMKRWEGVSWDGLVMCRGTWLIFTLTLHEVVKKKHVNLGSNKEYDFR